jgi:hypothetical protein
MHQSQANRTFHALRGEHNHKHATCHRYSHIITHAKLSFQNNVATTSYQHNNQRVTTPRKYPHFLRIIRIHDQNTRGIIYIYNVAGLLMRGALSDERTDQPFTVAAGLRQRSHFWVRVSRDSCPQPGGAGRRIYTPQEQGSPLYPQALGSLLLASYDLQGYCGGIRTRLHTVVTTPEY